MTDLSIAQEYAVGFAEYMYRQHDHLEPWTSKNAETYIPPVSAFGGRSAQPDVVFEFWPMTPEEYTAETGTSLPPPELNFNVSERLMVDPTLEEDRIRWDWFNYRRASGTLEGMGLGSPHYGTRIDAPWAQALHDDWTTAVENRCGEVDDIRAELEYLTEAIIKAADSYMGMDIENETGLNLTEMGRES